MSRAETKTTFDVRNGSSSRSNGEAGLRILIVTIGRITRPGHFEHPRCQGLGKLLRWWKREVGKGQSRRGEPRITSGGRALSRSESSLDGAQRSIQRNGNPRTSTAGREVSVSTVGQTQTLKIAGTTSGVYRIFLKGKTVLHSLHFSPCRKPDCSRASWYIHRYGRDGKWIVLL